jgi:hypothetical protein
MEKIKNDHCKLCDHLGAPNVCEVCPCHTPTPTAPHPEQWEEQLFKLMNFGHFTIQQVTEFVAAQIKAAEERGREEEKLSRTRLRLDDFAKMMNAEGAQAERERILKCIDEVKVVSEREDLEGIADVFRNVWRQIKPKLRQAIGGTNTN